MPEPPRPDSKLIPEYLIRWSKLEKYPVQEEALGVLYRDLCPANTKIEHVLLKVSALNDFYSTNILDSHAVANHILDLNIDARMANDDYELVNEIARNCIKGKSLNFYSFASKYCSHHKPLSYPIFDFFIEKMMLHYQKTDGFATFSKSDLKDYPRFISVIKSFRQFYGLDTFSLKQIDVFLWIVGKDCFPRRYYRRGANNTRSRFDNS